MNERPAKPTFRITAELLRTYSEILDVPLREDEMEVMTNRVTALMADVARLWDVDVTDVEMSLTMPPRRRA